MDINALFQQIVTLFRKLNKQQKIIIFSTIGLLLAFLSFLVVFNKSSQTLDDGYRVLFDNLNPKDSALIIQQLQTDQIPYKLENENVIKIPKEYVYEQRIKVASQGIPSESRVGFELFDQAQFGATDFEQKIKYLRALEGELAQTIEALTPIQKAKVHIALPKESVFVSKQIPPTASVVLKLEPNMILNIKQIRGIKNLTAAAITKLTPENVKVVNENGDPLGETDDMTLSGELAAAQFKYKKDYERAYEQKIEKMLAPFVGGEQSVVAKVTVDFDFTKIDKQEETYDPNNVVRGEKVMEEKREGYRVRDIGGVPGAVSNIGPVKGIDDGDKKEKYSKSQAVTNYEISKRVESIQGQFATIKRITAAVVVDGKYNIKLNEESGDEEIVYTALDDTQIEAITQLVRQAIGYTEQRGDDVTVSNFRFNIPNIEEPKNKYEQMLSLLEPYIPFFKYLIAALLLFIFYKLVIVPFAQKMLEIPVEDDEKKAAIIKLGEIEDEEDMKAQEGDLRKKVEEQLGLRNSMNEDAIRVEVMFNKIREQIEERPEEAAMMFATLIKENQEDH
jgi:flagellar M-ring protein FliF